VLTKETQVTSERKGPGYPLRRTSYLCVPSSGADYASVGCLGPTPRPALASSNRSDLASPAQNRARFDPREG